MQRFWSKVDQAGEGQCWEWTGATFSAGYGAFKMRVDGEWKQCKAHRVAWELAVGPIPSGLFVCHHCDNPRCCNPGHLFLGTAQDNSRDMVRKGRSRKGDTYIRPTECIRGHAFTPENTRYNAKGHRRCLACEANRRKSPQWKANMLAWQRANRDKCREYNRRHRERCQAA